MTEDERTKLVVQARKQRDRGIINQEECDNKITDIRLQYAMEMAGIPVSVKKFLIGLDMNDAKLILEFLDGTQDLASVMIECLCESHPSLDS